MARLFMCDDDGTPWVEITEDDDGYHGACRSGEALFHHRELDLVEAASIHVTARHG